MARVEESLDWQIWFKKNDDGTDSDRFIPFHWYKNGEPVTFRSAYPRLKNIIEVEENGTIQKSKTVRKVENTTNRTFGHGIKPKKFGQEQIDKIIELRADGLSYRKIGEKVDCAASTVKEYLDKYNSNSI